MTKSKAKIIKPTQLMIFMLAFVFVCFRPMHIAKVVGDSMKPNYKNGQFVVALRWYPTVQKGDVVLVNTDEGYIIKRIAYMPGEKIVVVDQGMRKYIPICSRRPMFVELKNLIGLGEKASLYTVPDNAVFILGDNACVSDDSRDFGAVPLNQIVAKVITR